MISKNILSAEWVSLIRRNAFEAEQIRKLPAVVVQSLIKEKALKVMMPKSCNGLEWPLPKTVAFFEALAEADGNTGWVVNLGAGANMFAGYFEKEVARSIFDRPEIWCAGSGAATGKAIRKTGGYLVSGRWKYASGTAHATHFTVNALLQNEKGRHITKEGKPVFLSFIFDRKNATIYDTWNTTGLRATSSHEFGIENIFVPEEQSFSLQEPSPFAFGPLYRFPFDILAVVNMAIMPIGMGLHFLALYRELIKSKKPLYGNSTLNEHPLQKQSSDIIIPSFLSARNDLYDRLKQAWDFYENGGQAPAPLLREVVEAARAGAEKARELVFRLYPFCGMNMVFSGSELNKVWRDISVASQHYLLSPLTNNY